MTITPPTDYTPLQILYLSIIILAAQELLQVIVSSLGTWIRSKHIPVRGKHLDVLSAKDLLFIFINKAMTGPFIWCFFTYVWIKGDEGDVTWGGLKSMSFTNTILPLPIIFIIYDFFYTLLHWALHIKAIYGFIHKHHHHQKAPSRANVDAVNVHPIEFFLGEFNHLFAVHLYITYVQPLGIVPSLHAITVVLFLAIGGILAGLNHTRFDVVIGRGNNSAFFGGNDTEKKNSGGGFVLYDSKVHDVHHRIPQSNYGQYTMFWDKIFGSFREYNENDRVNPMAQLDPQTGKSLQYMEDKEKSVSLSSNKTD
mmetsp:Transcript_28379/g.41439  ORF Transcript_28379/g.41439 Transcript_28379/m.41439 type:complete len:310 (+) Transcript_28379:249-1178(+)